MSIEYMDLSNNPVSLELESYNINNHPSLKRLIIGYFIKIINKNRSKIAGTFKKMRKQNKK